ncbi:MAG TPA: DMT family transporter [Anaerolineaceae bacterium]
METQLSTAPVSRWVRLRADLLLLLTAAIWGGAFVAQRMVAADLGIFLFNGSRFLLGALALLAILRFRFSIQRHNIKWVLLAGTVLFAASGFQQAGLITTTAGNAGFITSLYVVMIPLILRFVLGKRLTWSAWVAAGLAVAGALFLSTGGALRLVAGDGLELICALLFAIHVILVGKLVQHIPILEFSIGQFIVCGVLNILTGLLLERQSIPLLPGAWAPIAYAGILSVGAGYTLQAIGQRHAPPSDAAIILSMESVFAALSGFLILGEDLTAVQIMGCVLILAAILLAQIQPQKEGMFEKKSEDG